VSGLERDQLAPGAARLPGQVVHLHVLDSAGCDALRHCLDLCAASWRLVEKRLPQVGQG
jgi:hypothetical protein